MEPTNTAVVTPSVVGLRYGLLTGLVSIIISFGLYVLHLEQNSYLRFITSVVLIVGIILAQREYKALNGGFMGYGEGLGIGLLVAAVVGALSAAFVYVYTTFIDPETLTRALDKARADMEAKGTMSDAQIDQAMAFSAKFTSGPILLVFVVVGTLFMGLLVSLLTAAFVKNPKPEFE